MRWGLVMLTGACTPQQLEQSCLETADWSRVQFVLLQLQPFCHLVAFSFCVSTCQWLLLGLVVSDMVLWFAKLGELTTVGDWANDVLKEISPHKASWEEKLLGVHKLQAKVYDLEAFSAVNSWTVHSPRAIEVYGHRWSFGSCGVYHCEPMQMSGALPVALLPRCALRHSEQPGVKESWLWDLSQTSYNLNRTCRNLPSCVLGGMAGRRNVYWVAWVPLCLSARYQRAWMDGGGDWACSMRGSSILQEGWELSQRHAGRGAAEAEGAARASSEGLAAVGFSQVCCSKFSTKDKARIHDVDGILAGHGGTALFSNWMGDF